MNNQNNIHLRLAHNNDADQIHHVLANSFIEYKNLYTKGAYDLTVASTDEIQKRIKEGQVWVAEQFNQIVGTVGGLPKNNEFHIRGMVVLPEMRGKKIGYRLLQIAEVYAFENGYTLLTLRSSAYLDRAIRLYKRFGFKISNEPPYDMYGTPCINMKKDVSKPISKAVFDIDEKQLKTYLIIENYKTGKTQELYQRFSEKGRMMPKGVNYINSWVTDDLQKCYQIITSESEEKLLNWTKSWKDLVDFEIVPIISSKEAQKELLNQNN